MGTDADVYRATMRETEESLMTHDRWWRHWYRVLSFTRQMTMDDECAPFHIHALATDVFIDGIFCQAWSGLRWLSSRLFSGHWQSRSMLFAVLMGQMQNEGRRRRDAHDNATRLLATPLTMKRIDCLETIMSAFRWFTLFEIIISGGGHWMPVL